MTSQRTERARRRRSGRRFAAGGLAAGVSILCLCTSSPASAWQDDAPLTDAIAKPAGVDVVPRAEPRSMGRDDLFGGENRVVTPALDVEALLAEDEQQTELGAQRVGVVQGFEPVSSAEDGVWTELDNGEGWLWTYSFRATGAEAVRLRVDPFDPPLGAELIVYNPDVPDAVRGPITSTYQPFNKLWTPTLYVEEVRLEYYLPSHVSPDDPDVHITVTSLLNQYRAAGGGPVQAGGALPCHLDVSCFDSWEFHANAVATTSFVSNEFGFFCSGAMMNRIGGDFTPFFTTAFHCGVDAGNADSLLTTWFYQTDACNGNVPDLNTLPQTQGITLLVNNNANDYTLVGLSSANTGGVTYAGWDAGGWSDNSASIGIHHPRGSWKRITFGTKDGLFNSCIGGADAGHAIFNDDGDGEVEPGSSGSPIFDSSARIRGTASCANWGCNEDNAATYGRFDQAWGVFSPYLNPTDPVYVDNSWGGNEQGTQSEPFDTVIEGVFAVLRDSNVFIDAGNYGENIRIDKAMTLNAQGGVVRIGN